MQEETAGTESGSEKEEETVVPSITQPVLGNTESGSSIRLWLSFTSTNCEGVKLEVKASDTGSVVESSGDYDSGDYLYVSTSSSS